MKKRVLTSVIAALLIMASAFVMTACGSEEPQQAEDYPKIAYIDNVSYYGTDRVCEMVPRIAPSGIIETFVSEEIMPDAPMSANFGAEYGSMEYIFLEDGQLIIHMGEEWYYFEEQPAE